MIHPLQHEITLDLASGAKLKLRYFSDREQRWIFSYNYVSPERAREPPDVINKVCLVANYDGGLLEDHFVLSMHVVIPSRLGREFLAGLDISPGAKTYLEFNYVRSSNEYKLTEICKGARERVRLDKAEPAIIRPLEFPFPIPDRVPIKFGKLQIPFRTNADIINHFDLPEKTSR
jgi:hypothetical protein